MEDVIVADSSRVDSMNPFFLHHSDNPGLVVVSKILTGDNYASWVRSMSKSLNAKNKLGFVNGNIKTPSQTENPDDYASWSRCNDMIHSWIVNSLASDIADSVIYYATAQEIWEDLRERFSQSNAPRIYEIQRDIAYLRQDQLSVAAYYTKLKGLWDELSSYTETCQCGTHQDRQRLMQFLMGLNDSYSAVRGQVLLMNPLPSIRQAYSSISQEERQRFLTQSIPQSGDMTSAMAVRKELPERRGNKGHQGFRNYRGDQNFIPGQENRSNQTQKGNNRIGERSGRRPHCTHCDIPGHYVDNCYQLHGYPPNHPKHRDNRFKGGNDRGQSQANHVTDQVGYEKGARTSAVDSLSEEQLKTNFAPFEKR